MITLFELLFAWANGGDTTIRISEEVGYGIVAGFFLLIALYVSTKPIGGN